MIQAWFRHACVALSVGALMLVTPNVASAEPVSSISRIEVESARTVIAHVYSASMDRVVRLRVRTPADTSEPRPTLYLLNGAGGGDGQATWDARTDVDEFFADKNVNVVTPLDGSFTYYTDWERDDPALGRNKWTTFLTQELPPIIDEQFRTSGGVNAIAGLSMSGTSVLSLAIAAPTLYRAVGGLTAVAPKRARSWGGNCTSGRWWRAAGEADAENMWGTSTAGMAANDPYVNADKLRGIDLYISSATGLPGGPHENLGARSVENDPGLLLNQIVVGGVIEAAVDACTHRLAARLDELGIPARFEFRSRGTHSWGLLAGRSAQFVADDRACVGGVA